MADIVIVDTDILIDTGRGADEAIACLNQIEKKFSIAFSTVTQMELIVGCRDKRELRLLNNFLKRFQGIKLDEQISDISVGLLKRYRLSHGLLIADAIIAATAMGHRVPLASKNQRDFQFIEELDLLPYPNPYP
ncbi:MAG: type II toxin-antitoxin system VapC family toxin [Deltaproteobacteria bacterium]|nr:type II toxin-antitoxin system VapC family toxin [Deltaproteobacteria bacterium]